MNLSHFDLDFAADRNDVVTIGAVLAKTRKKPLSIEKFFNTSDPKALLLETKSIPFEIIINGPKFDAIISMLPGDAIHKMHALSSSKYHPQRMIDWFVNKKQRIGFEKIFYIATIKGIDSSGSPVIYKDVIIHCASCSSKKFPVIYVN